MKSIWPGTLYFLGLVPVLIGLYVWILQRRRRYAVRYSSLSLVRGLPQQSWLRRHLPFVLLMLALASLVIAASRPTAVLSFPANRATVILDLDVSQRMCAGDIPPTRLQAAEAAARSFIAEQKPNTEIGIVAFAGFAELIQPPTTDQDALQAALRSLISGSGDAVGSGILKALDAIAATDPRVAPSGASPSLAQPVHAPEIIVLLSDGVNDTGPSPLDAAREAAERGVRIYTIGLGTANAGSSVSCQSSDPSEWASPDSSAGSGNGAKTPPAFDESTLKGIAALTGGAYYPASSLDQLRAVFDELSTHAVVDQVTFELSAAFAALGGLLAIAAFGMSLFWHPLP